MKRLAACFGIPAAVGIILFSSLAGLASERKFVEDFSTTLHKDAANTTAWWDTVAGELKLFPFVPTLVGTCDTPNWALGVTVSGNLAFVADHSSGLQVIDISDPTNPTIVGTCDTPGLVYCVAVSGNFAFVTDYAFGIQVVDISDPTNPTIVGGYDTVGLAIGVAVSGNYVYVADYALGLVVLQFDGVSGLTLVGTCSDNPLALASRVAVSGGNAFVTVGSEGLQVVNISDPSNPTLLGTCDTPGKAWEIALPGEDAFVTDYALVTDYGFGLQVIDISNPMSPTIVGTYATPDTALGVAISGDYAFVTALDFGLQVVDISDPAHPTLAGSCDTPGRAWAVAASGENAYVADFTSGLQVIQAFRGEGDPNNQGQSLVVATLPNAVNWFHLATTQVGSITWELSVDGGSSWHTATSNEGWIELYSPEPSLLWRSRLQWTEAETNPSVTRLEIDWLSETAPIDSIVDVPGDQGGWVFVHFTRSGRDSALDLTPISNYGIWRRVDNSALVAALETQAAAASDRSIAGNPSDAGELPVIEYQGKTYVHSRAGLAASPFPPGIWALVVSVPAVQQDAYVAVVPTVKDSSSAGTNYDVFVVTAHTTSPWIWYASEPDSGYSVDNIAPAVPMSFAVAYNTGSGNHLSWGPSLDEDFQYFRVYRSSNPEFVPSPSELVHSLTGTSWSDPDYDGWSVYYKITALDYAGNESAPASPTTTTAVKEPVIPQSFGLYPNAPNPFNPSTTIRYDVPAGGGVATLRVYDVAGRLVRTLVNGPQTAGQKRVTWSGTDDRDRGVVSGVYFYCLQAPGYKKTLKMILVR